MSKLTVMYVRTVDITEDLLYILLFPPVPNINRGWRLLDEADDNSKGIGIHVMLWYIMPAWRHIC